MAEIIVFNTNKFNISYKNLGIHILATERFAVNPKNASFTIPVSSSRFSISEIDRTLFMLFQINSIGFKSGEYGGR